MTWLLLIAPIVTVVSLRWRGRPWYRNAYSQGWIDRWTVSHIGHGVVVYAAVRAFALNASWLLPFTAAILWACFWESIENRDWMIRLFRSGGDKRCWGDSVANSLSDLVACALGALGMRFLLG